MRNKHEEAISTRWTKEDGSFDREAYEADEEVQEVLAKRKRLGHTRPMYSLADGTNHTMPEKAQRSLLDQNHAFTDGRPEKKRKSVTKTFAEYID